MGKLRDLTKSVRIQALRDGKYNTIGDLQGVEAEQLSQLPHIKRKSATQVVRAVTGLEKYLYDQRLALPPPGEIGTQFESLLRAVYQRLRCRGIPKTLLSRLQSATQRLQGSVSSAIRIGRFLNRVFRRGKTECQLELAYRHLSSVHDSPDTAELLAEADAILNALEPPDEFEGLVADFREHYADYFAIIERAFDSAWGVAAAQQASIQRGRRGGVPEAIASRVEQFVLSVDDLNVDLRGYQEFGAKYLLHQKRTVLGDEMGLGKTIQAMAAMNHLRNIENSTHFLVVCPASIIGNWIHEIRERLTIPVRVLHGADRDAEAVRWRRLGGIAVTSYSTLSALDWGTPPPIHFMVADEAHYVKNPNARRTQSVAQLAATAQKIVLMTGTALENRPGEFVSLIHVCDRNLAQRLHRATTDNLATVVGAREFERLVAPVYLRRNQEDVLRELPECIETDEWVNLDDRDRERYLNAVGSRQLMAMRQAANGESLGSAKFERLRQLLDHYRSEGEKVVIFSYFLRSLDLVQQLAADALRIDGKVHVTRRMEVIATFTSTHGPAVMISQILAGGVGINLQAASSVILLEPQLKPTTEWQAIKRVHRMGQSRKVVVHRLLARETVDESLQELLGRKTVLFNEYARESAIKKVSAAAIDTSEATVAQRLVQMEVKRREAALAT